MIPQARAGRGTLWETSWIFVLFHNKKLCFYLSRNVWQPQLSHWRGESSSCRFHCNVHGDSSAVNRQTAKSIPVIIEVAKVKEQTHLKNLEVVQDHHDWISKICFSINSFWVKFFLTKNYFICRYWKFVLRRVDFPTGSNSINVRKRKHLQSFPLHY